MSVYLPKFWDGGGRWCIRSESAMGGMVWMEAMVRAYHVVTKVRAVLADAD